MISKIKQSDFEEGLIALTQDHKIKLFLTEFKSFGFDFMTFMADMIYNKVKDEIN